jgi:hypothetical protein
MMQALFISSSNQKKGPNFLPGSGNTLRVADLRSDTAQVPGAGAGAQQVRHRESRAQDPLPDWSGPARGRGRGRRDRAV